MGLTFEILIPLFVWVFASWFFSDRWRNKNDAFYVLLMPIALVGALFCITLFSRWLY